MAADDIQTINPATGLASETLAQPGAVAPVSAEALERWTRAVTAPAASQQQDADPPAAAPAKADPHQPGQLEQQPSFGHLNAPGQPPSAPSAAQPRLSAPFLPETEDLQPLPFTPVSTQSRANAFFADTKTADASSLQPQPTTTPSPASANQRAAFSEVSPLGAALQRPTSTKPEVTTTSQPQDGSQAAGVAFNAQETPVPLHTQGTGQRGEEVGGGVKKGVGLQPAIEQNEVPSKQYKESAGQRREDSTCGDDAGDNATAALKSQPALVQNETDATRALPLSALRGLHAHHRQSRFDAALPDRVNAEGSAAATTALNATADLLMPRIQAQPSPDAGVATNSVGAVGGKEQLHALIESCCSRLWVNDGGGRAPQGVMLDLGRWMPGATIEVAKAAGVLRITLRGVDGAERARLEDELQGLGDGLAEKLGCQVVAAVATNKELT
ncbi:MAG: hypothetical protein HEQ39_05620 [Rhizobacter sp.]